EVLHTAFSLDGRRVATSGDDSTVRVWDATAGEPLTVPLKQEASITGVAFTPDGSRLIARLLVPQADGTSRATERLWQLPTTDRPSDDLLRQAQLQSSHRIDPTGSFVPLEQGTLRTDWQALRARYAEDSSASPADVLAWHRRQADASQAAGDWFA